MINSVRGETAGIVSDGLVYDTVQTMVLGCYTVGNFLSDNRSTLKHKKDSTLETYLAMLSKPKLMRNH